MTKVIVRVHPVHLMNETDCCVADNPSQLTWAMCPPRIGCYHRHNPHEEQQKEHCNYSSRHFGYARQLKLKIVIITLEINIPGSVTPNGWLVWPRPPTMLIPREPLHFVTVTRCRNTEKITVIKLTMTHTHTFNGPLSGTTWDEPVPGM